MFSLEKVLREKEVKGVYPLGTGEEGGRFCVGFGRG